MPNKPFDRVNMEKDLLSRINRVQGQLESTKRLTREEKAVLMLELHSAIRALESIKKFIVIEDLNQIRERFEMHKDDVGLGLVDEILGQLAQKHNDRVVSS